MTFTKEQLIAAAHGRIDFANMMLSDNPEPLKERTWAIELHLAKIALVALTAGMEQEPAGWQFKSVNGHWIGLIDELGKNQAIREGCDVRPVYAAQQLPQPAVPECYQRLLHHAYGMTMGHDWNKGTMAGHHREKLCKAVEDCRAAMLNRQRVDHVDGAPPTTIKPVPDLYEVTVPGGRSTTFTTDAAEAKDCADMGWKVQEYVTLERYQAAMLQGAEPEFREISNSSTKHFRENAETSTKCWCHTCRPVTVTDVRFVVCPECGNKRCPRANDCRSVCTGSNEPGQEGSAYPAAPQQEVK